MNYRKYLIPVLAPLALLFAACDKLPGNIDAEIMRDCTGTYLIMEGKNYQVCNPVRTNPFNQGDKVSVSFKKASTCGIPEPACYKMLPPVADNIEVLRIRKKST